MSKIDICFIVWASVSSIVLIGTFLVGAYLDGKENKEFKADNWMAEGLMFSLLWPILPLVPFALLGYFFTVTPFEWLCKKLNQAGREAGKPPLNQHPTAKPVEKSNPCCHLIPHIVFRGPNYPICGHVDFHLDCAPCATQAKLDEMAARGTEK